MSDKIEVRVPDIGDFTDVEVIEVHVSAGDTVAIEDPLITLETDKASMDVPSTAAGRVLEVAVSAGDKVSEGSLVLTVAEEEAGTAAEADASAPTAAEPQAVTSGDGAELTVTVPDIGDFTDVDVIEVHVAAGDSVAAEDPLITLETDKASMDVPAPAAGVIKSLAIEAGDKVSEGSDILVLLTEGGSRAPAAEPAPPPIAKAGPAPGETPAAPSAAPKTAPRRGELPPIDEPGFARAHASPSVRRFARELGVDLGRVTGSGVKGRINRDDVKAFVKSVLSGQGAAVAPPALPAVPEVDFAKYGEIDVQPL
ncbi:MAG: E3 binding domain-containing protein, partial [Gammaproteobacteria bacterium]